MAEHLDLTGILDKIHEDTEGDTLSVGKIMDALEHRGFGPLIMITGLITASPVGAVPGLPLVTSLLIILFASQLLFGRTTPWAPEKFRSMSIEKAKFDKAREKLQPVTRRVDKLLKPRLAVFTSDTAIKMVAFMCILLALIITPLEFVPFGVTTPAVAIVLFSVGISMEDGLIILLGLLLSVISLIGAGYWLFW